MKKIILILILLVTANVTIAQNIGSPVSVATVLGTLKTDSLVLFPLLTDTPTTAHRCRREGSIIRVTKSAGDTVLYQFNNGKWFNIDGSVSAGYIPYSDTLTKIPTINYLNNTYLGSANITTLGTIITGIWHGTAIGDSYISSATTWNAKVSTGAVTGSGLTMATSRLLGRTTASTGAIEEISATSPLSLSAGALSMTAAAAGASGYVNTTTQSFAGAKTFTGQTTHNAGIVIPNGQVLGLGGSGTASQMSGSTSTGEWRFKNEIGGYFWQFGYIRSSVFTPFLKMEEGASSSTKISLLNNGYIVLYGGLLAAPIANAIESDGTSLYYDRSVSVRSPVYLGGLNSQSGTSYTIVSADMGQVVLLTNSAARTITLPLANSVPVGLIVQIKDGNGNAGTNNITVNRSGGDDVDGSTSSTINTNYGSKGYVSDGAVHWYVIN